MIDNFYDIHECNISILHILLSTIVKHCRSKKTKGLVRFN